MMRTFLFLLALLAAGCSRPDGVTVLTYGTPYAPRHPFSQADIVWMKFVEAESAGRLKIQPYWSGGLLSSDESMLEVRHGVVDIGLITPIYARGGAHVLRTQAGFYGGVKSYADQLAVYHCLQDTFPDFNRETEGLKVLAVQGGNLPGVLTRERQVRTLEDFRGLRLRAPTELTGLLDSLGADPVNMPMGDVYSALAKGVLDGVVAPEDTLQSLHFNEVAQHYSTARFARGAYPSRAMSAKRWTRLSAEERDVLERSIPVWENAMRDLITKAQKVGHDYGVKQGIDFVPFDAAEQTKLDKIYNDEALKAAKGLARDGGDAEPIYRRAQDAIAAVAAGRPACATGEKS